MNSSHLQVFELWVVLIAFHIPVLVNPVYFNTQKGPQENDFPDSPWFSLAFCS